MLDKEQVNNQIQKFDPATLMQGIKDRIKSEFVSLIPDEQWNEMIKKETENFFREKETGYSNRTYASDFAILVRDELRKEAQKRLVDYLNSPEFNVMYGEYGQPIASQKVKELLIDNAGLVLQNMFGGMFSLLISDFSQQLRNRQY